MLLNEGSWHGKRLLKPETVRLMTSNQIGSVVVDTMPAADPKRSAAFPFGAGKDKFGLGFQITVTEGPHTRARRRKLHVGRNQQHPFLGGSEKRHRRGDSHAGAAVLQRHQHGRDDAVRETDLRTPAMNHAPRLKALAVRHSATPICQTGVITMRRSVFSIGVPSRGVMVGVGGRANTRPAAGGLVLKPTSAASGEGISNVALLNESGARVLRVDVAPNGVRNVHSHDDVDFHLFVPVSGTVRLEVAGSRWNWGRGRRNSSRAARSMAS